MVKKLVVVFILGALGACGFYLYVDRAIVAALDYRKPNNIPAVYADTFTLPIQRSVPVTLLAEELKERAYREIRETPKRPGEFSLNDTAAEIFTREFDDAEGSTHEASLVSLGIENGRVHNATANPLVLEPEIIAHLGNGEMRASTFKPLKEIPDAIKHAVIAIEDERFYEHHGVDLQGILRAIFVNLRAMRLVQGGSTLTQQLAKNLLFTPRKTLGRKLLEVAAAISLETRYTKDQILELYLNEVYLGQEGAIAVHGVGEAAASFFGKKLSELNLSECALLAGIIRAPSAYSPRKALRKALKRRDLVLSKMEELKFITPAQENLAKISKVRISDASYHSSRVAPHFIESLNKKLGDAFNVEAAMLSGLNVYTSLNRQAQLCAESAVTEGARRLEKDFPKITKGPKPIEVGLVAIEPFSGKIRAWVGGRDFSENQFDHVSQAVRQIGSTIKPFLYLTALDAGLNSYRPATPLTILPDEPMHIDVSHQPTWEPENYDRKFRGDVTLRYALENSLNMPAAYISTRVGIPALVRTAKKFRLGESIPAVPSLALGAADTTLLRLTAAYGALANGGNYVEPRMFLSALDGEKNSLARGELYEERVASEDAVYVLTNILQGVLERGTAKVVRNLGYKRDAAGKTGTSNETRDAWFVAFGPDLVAGVWVGFDDNSKTGLTGGQAAAPIWTEFMKCVEQYTEPMEFIAPPGVIYAQVDSKTGGLASRSCPDEDVVREIFVRGTEPFNRCSLHGRYGEDPNPRGGLDRDYDSREPTRRKKGLWEMLFGD